jgi:Flp pilus assembly protein TadD
MSAPHPAVGEAIFSLRAGRLEDAERQFKKILRQQPRHPAALNLLGIIYAQQRRFVDAEKYLKLAVSVGAP